MLYEAKPAMIADAPERVGFILGVWVHFMIRSASPCLTASQIGTLWLAESRTLRRRLS